MKRLFALAAALLLLCSCGKKTETSPYTIEDGHYTCSAEELTDYINSRIDDDGGEVPHCDLTEDVLLGGLCIYTVEEDGYVTRIHMVCGNDDCAAQYNAYVNYIIDAVDAEQHDEIDEAFSGGAVKVEAVADYELVGGAFTAKVP